jgi:hypothetical protein
MASTIETLTTANSLTVGTKAPRQFQGLFDVIPFQFTIEEDSVAGGAASQADIAVTGAALGDFVFVAAAADYVSAQLTAFVNAANSVTVSWQNLETADANTALATAVECKGFVLKPKGIFDSLA